ncbi:DUF397 domain-containing protein [Actinoallomurus purpureus]|nr:DUF397 domain-containing protein [Actinoallomurus purpureus]MCO6006652.1 DUF397 domain-containing protein [Actinoallomurus purpureus]
MNVPVWRKSSRSGAQQGDCVEIAVVESRELIKRVVETMK